MNAYITHYLPWLPSPTKCTKTTTTVGFVYFVGQACRRLFVGLPFLAKFEVILPQLNQIIPGLLASHILLSGNRLSESVYRLHVFLLVSSRDCRDDLSDEFFHLFVRFLVKVANAINNLVNFAVIQNFTRSGVV